MVSRLADRVFNKIFEGKKNNKINNLMKIPIKDKGYDVDFNDDKPINFHHQIDILYLPEDETTKDKYLMVVVDISTRLMDARPLKTRNMKEIIKKLNDIYNNGILERPKILQMDEEFNNKDFRNAFNDIYFKVNKVGRHKQNAFVENRNYIIGRILHTRMNAEEVFNNDFADVNNHYSKSWTKYLKDIIKEVNNILKKEPILFDKNKDKSIKFNKKRNGKILSVLNIGTKVRIILEEPKDTKEKKLIGKFRASDLRWENKIYKVKNIVLRPNHPVRYQVDKLNDNNYYSKNELQVVEDDEENIPIKAIEKYIFEKIISKKMVKHKIYYLIKWKGFSDENNSWQQKKELIKDGFTKEINDYEKSLNQ